MRVNHIEINNQRHDAVKSIHCAEVIVQSTTQRQQLTASCDDSYTDTVDIRRALIADALRQIRRMPEYRSGNTRLELAEELEFPDAENIQGNRPAA